MYHTYTGKIFDPLNVEALEVDIKDIAHALSQVTRYNGHLEQPYTVAQHSLLVADLVENHYKRPDLAIQALLHDASEAYLPDIPTDIKVTLPDFIALENRLHKHIANALGIKYPFDPIVKEVDRLVQGCEVVSFQTWEPWVTPPFSRHLFCMSHKHAESAFLDLYY